MPLKKKDRSTEAWRQRNRDFNANYIAFMKRHGAYIEPPIVRQARMRRERKLTQASVSDAS